jgi:hypothetical protein
MPHALCPFGKHLEYLARIAPAFTRDREPLAQNLGSVVVAHKARGLIILILSLL